jgi:hypothetical protein
VLVALHGPDGQQTTDEIVIRQARASPSPSQPKPEPTTHDPRPTTHDPRPTTHAYSREHAHTHAQTEPKSEPRPSLPPCTCPSRRPLLTCPPHALTWSRRAGGCWGLPASI